MSPSLESVGPAALRRWPLPTPGGDKHSRGRILVVGGARRTPGAVLLAGVAALRVGAGILSMAVGDSRAAGIAAAVPEAAVLDLAESDSGAICADNASLIAQELHRIDALLIGPGLDDAEQTRGMLERLAELAESVELPPIVLDAYALGALAIIGQAPEPWRGKLVLTPNIGEAARLLQVDPDDLDDIGQAAADIALRYQAVVSCFGYVAEPGGRRWVLDTGHPGLGTSGSGDVLAGAVAGLCARGAENSQAACWGTYLHAAAGDRLAARIGALGFLARELLDEIPSVLSELQTFNDQGS